METLLADVEEVLHRQLNGETKNELFSKDFLRRFIFEYGTKEVRIQTRFRNVIALYLGYADWEDFQQKNNDLDRQNIHINYVNIEESFLPALRKMQVIPLSDEPYTTFQVVKPRFTILRWAPIFLGVMAVAVLGYFGFDWWQNRPFLEKDLNSVKFEIIKTIGKYPQAVRIKYDVSSLPTVRNIEIETGVGKIVTSTHFEGFSMVSNKKIDTLAQTYFFPGVYQLKLSVNNKEVKHLYHTVYSKPNLWTVWGFGVAFEKNWVTNINPTSNYIKNGVFHFNPNELPKEIKNEDDLKNTVHVLVQDFGVSLDSTQVEARMKNPQNEGGESCYDMSIHFNDKNFNAIGAKFTTEGCTDFASLIAGKTFFRIQNNKRKNIDLDNFGVNQDEWNVFKFVVKGKVLEVFVNAKLAFKGTFETYEAFADLVDTRITFKGAGSIDWVKVSNSYTGKVVYQTDFD